MSEQSGETVALTEAERAAICTCSWTYTGVLEGGAHERGCTLHREAVERVLATRIKALLDGETRLVDRVFDMTEWYCSDDHDWSGRGALHGRLHSAFVHRADLRTPPEQPQPPTSELTPDAQTRETEKEAR